MNTWGIRRFMSFKAGVFSLNVIEPEQNEGQAELAFRRMLVHTELK